MNTNTVRSAVFPALGEDLDTIHPFFNIDMNLAVFSVQFPLATHQARAHLNTITGTPPFEEGLAANFHSKYGFYLCGDQFSTQGFLSDSTVALVPLQQAHSLCKIVVDFHNIE